ncbi:MAG: UDP-N-acetylmuramate--L-alanine ligase [Pseudomonadota bacterium]
MTSSTPLADRWPRDRVRRVHFVGIGGVGMGGIAEVLLNMGYPVSGSDPSDNAMTRQLSALGADISRENAGSNVLGADVVVVSSAISADNPEVVAAREARIPVVPRAQMLAEIMRFRLGVAVAGTHGKTTTTSLIASVLHEGQLDPTFVIGGRLNSAGTNARLGQSDWLVAEADESDASFLHLSPVISIVTNVDADHLENYDGDFDKYKNTFVEFLHRLPFYGLAVLCIDDANVRAMLPALQRKFVTYGESEDADIRAEHIRADGLCMVFDAVFEEGVRLNGIRLNMPGKHNVSNALAAIAVARELGVGLDEIVTALENFEGVGRRVQRFGVTEVAGRSGVSVELVDDYAHHPSELQATLAAIRGAWPDRRLVALFQPHRYSRTRDLFDGFVDALQAVDVLLISEVYAAGEAPIDGATGRDLCKAVGAGGALQPVYLADIESAVPSLRMLLEDGDVLITLGAGSVGSLAPRLPALLGQEAISDVG